MPDGARDGRNVALIDKCFMVCSIVQRRMELRSICMYKEKECYHYITTKMIKGAGHTQVTAWSIPAVYCLSSLRVVVFEFHTAHSDL